MKKILGVVLILLGIGAFYIAVMTIMHGFYMLGGIRITVDASFVPFILGGIMIFAGISMFRD